MTHFLASLALLLSSFLIACATAHATGERRVALVLGNSAYRHTVVLPNARNDADDVAAAFKRLGFEVIEGSDLDKRSMERTIRQFGLKLAGADIALFFYAGHGVQVSGQNYLLPTDARLSTEGDVDFESIALHLVLKQMEREAKTSLLLLDACRDNPLARNLARTMGTRSGQIGQGLAEVKAGVGTLIGFSTQPGNVALDGIGRNSPYVAALLRHLEAPNKDFGSTLISVRNEVVKATNGTQVPWEHTSLMHEVVLTHTAPAEPRAVNYDKEMEIAFWNAIKDSKSPELLQTYIDRFPSGTFAGLARVLIDRAAKEQTADREVSKREDELRRADEAKWAAERQKREAEHRAAEVKLASELRKAQEDAGRARVALLAAENERGTALKAAERARKEQEEARKATETVVASLPNPPAASGQAGTVSINEEALTRSIQKELRRVGCDPGREDGKWGSAVTGALQKYNRLAKTALQTDGPTQDALAAIAARNGRICSLECRDDEREVGGRCVTKVVPKKPTAKEIRGSAKTASPTKTEECKQWERCVTFNPGHLRGRCGLQPAPC